MVPNVVKIYTLECPITNEILYVGKTIGSLSRRLSQHICDSKRFNYKTPKWIQQLKKNNLKPIINLIEEVDFNEWTYWEIYWIQQFKSWGFKLKNHQIGGGYDNTGHIAWNKGKKLSKEHKNKLKLAKVGYIPWNKGKTRFDLKLIIELYKNGFTQKEIALRFKTDQGTISRYIKNYKKNKNKV